MNTQGIPWCRIFHNRVHQSKEFLYLQKIVSAPTSLYCKFFRSVGHEEKDSRAYQMLQNKIVDTYLMKNDEQMQVERTEAQFTHNQYTQAQFPHK